MGEPDLLTQKLSTASSIPVKKCQYNVRPPIKTFHGRKEYLNLVHESLQDKKLTIISESKALETNGCGVGYRNKLGLGLGKTETARQYISLYGAQFYNNLIWLNANSEESLQLAFIDLSKNHLKLDQMKSLKNSSKLANKIIEEVHKHICLETTLLVFDNVDNYKVIEKFLPVNQPQPQQLVSILIIENSRNHQNQDWNQHSGQVFQLDLFSLEESIQFIKESLEMSEIELNTSQMKKDLTDLGQLLRGCPLAVQQAVAFINQKNKTKHKTIKNPLKLAKKFSINDYTQMFKNVKKSMSIQDEDGGEMDKIFKIVLNINLQKILGTSSNRSTTNYTSKYSQIVDTLACLSSDYIESNLLQLLDPQLDTSVLEKCLHFLQDLSVIKLLANNNPNGRLGQSKFLICMDRICQEIVFEKLSTQSPEKMKQLFEDFAIQSKLILDDCLQIPQNSLFKNLITLTRKTELSQIYELGQPTFALSGNQIMFKVNFASKLKTIGWYDSSLYLYQNIYQFIKNQMGQHHEMTLSAETQIANLLYSKGDFNSALQFYYKIYERQKEINLNRNNSCHSIIDTMKHIACILNEQQEFNKANLMYREIFEVKKKILGPHHPDTLKFLEQMADLQESQGRLEDALGWYQEAFEITKWTLREDHPQALKILDHQATVLKNLGRIDEALIILEKTFQKRKSSLGKFNLETIKSQCEIASVLREQLKLGDALEIYEKALIGSIRGFGEDHSMVYEIRNCIADVLKDQGKIPDAVIMYQEILGRSRKSLGKNHPFYVKSMENLNQLKPNQLSWTCQKEYFI